MFWCVLVFVFFPKKLDIVNNHRNGLNHTSYKNLFSCHLNIRKILSVVLVETNRFDFFDFFV